MVLNPPFWTGDCPNNEAHLLLPISFLPLYHTLLLTAPRSLKSSCPTRIRTMATGNVALATEGKTSEGVCAAATLRTLNASCWNTSRRMTSR